MENITDKLNNKNITNYSLHQLLFLIETLNENKKKFGCGKSFKEEPAILKAYCKLSAPSSDCVSFDNNIATLNTTSLVGIDSILPSHITEKIINQSQLNKSNKLLDFFNIFHQRLFGLSHKIEKKSKISLCSEDEYNTNLIKSIAGINNADLSFFYPFASFLWQKQKNMNSLKIILESMFLGKVEIKQFIKQKIKIENESKARFGKVLKNKILGNYANCIHKKIKIILIFKELEQYNNILPNTKNYNLLKKTCNYYLYPHFSFDIEIQLEKKSKIQLVLNKNNKIGINTWLGNKHNNSGFMLR